MTFLLIWKQKYKLNYALLHQPVGLCPCALEQIHHVWIFRVVVMGISWIAKGGQPTELKEQRLFKAMNDTYAQESDLEHLPKDHVIEVLNSSWDWKTYLK